MILLDVMEQLADRLDTIDGLRVHPYPPDAVHPPAAVITPRPFSFDSTYGRGSDRIALSIMVLVGKVSDRASWVNISKYADGSGAASIKTVAESGTYAAFDTIRITQIERWEITSVAGVEHLTATFTADIVGSGN